MKSKSAIINKKNSLEYGIRQLGEYHFVAESMTEQEDLILENEQIVCTCKTFYKNRYRKYYTCKHGYALLSALNYQWLSDYINR